MAIADRIVPPIAGSCRPQPSQLVLCISQCNENHVHIVRAAINNIDGLIVGELQEEIEALLGRQALMIEDILTITISEKVVDVAACFKVRSLAVPCDNLTTMPLGDCDVTHRPAAIHTQSTDGSKSANQCGTERAFARPRLPWLTHKDSRDRTKHTVSAYCFRLPTPLL